MCNDKARENKKTDLVTHKNIRTETETVSDPTEFFTPGPMHHWLASFTGTWEADVIGYMDPTMPDTSKLTQTYS
jgi:hypothetical protein